MPGIIIRRVDCRVGQTRYKKTKWEVSTIIQAGYNDGIRRWGNGGLGVVFGVIYIALADLHH